MKMVKIIRLVLNPGSFSAQDIPKLRAYLAKRFPGEFIAGFHIPQYLGLGKQAARGFGTVKKLMKMIYEKRKNI